MIQLDAQELLNIGHVHAQNFDAVRGKKLRGVSTDSRTLKQGNVFFAIRGEKFDGHNFVREAFSRGCVAAVVEESFVRAGSSERGLILLFVRDSVKALGELARRYRRRFDIPLIAITGSNGKTTTKEMTAEVLGEKYSVLKTEGNLNNHIGVPMTLLRLEKKHDVAVIEMGTNHFGEIEYLCSVAEPTHGLITNIAKAHLEFFSNIEGVAKAKGELFDWLGSHGLGFVNADDPLVLGKSRKLRKKVTYGLTGKRVNVKGRFLGLNRWVQPRFSVGGHPLPRPFSVQLRTPGTYATENAIAAAAVGIHFGVSAKKIKSALESFRPRSKRMEVLKVRGVTILNDTYNANPDSVLGALHTLGALEGKGKKLVVLGDMLELGEVSVEEHKRIAQEIDRLGFEYVLTYGEHSAVTATESKAPYAFHYEEKSALAAYLEELVVPGDIVLVKGSRGMKMEDVVVHLTEFLNRK